MDITSDKITYLGDGVYVQFDGYGIVLRTGHHEEGLCENQVYLEPEVLDRLNIFNGKVRSISNNLAEGDE